MKRINKVIGFFLVMSAFVTNANAQSTASASATATIVTPISITKNVDMNFGNIAVTSSGGTVILAAAGTRTKTGGITLPVVTGTVTAAQFTVTGEGTYTYDITLPSSAVTLTKSGGGATMDATSFTHSAGGSPALTAGSQVFNVGATLTVAAAQAAGAYTTGTAFNVAVNYN